MHTQSFGGHIGRTLQDSEPWFPARQRPAGPNVLVILLDDTGFAQLEPFGGDIATPAMQRLADEGLRYTRFHSTAICSASRAALLTGRNHHAVGVGLIVDNPMGFPGYGGRIPPSAASMPTILRDAGYNTMAVGKWHLTPSADRTPAGPFTTWPLGMGFERYYGFLRAEANHWTPTLVADNHYIETPQRPEDGYHLSEDLVDQALRMIARQQTSAPGKPFFMYLAPGAMHAPHHVPSEWSDRYRGAFDDGWERWRERAFLRQREAGLVPADTELPPRPSWIPDWDRLPAEERRLYARYHEVFAGFLTHMDAQIGRLLDALEQQGILDDTMIIVASDNGASAEGGVHGSRDEHRVVRGQNDDVADNLAVIDELGGFQSFNHYPWGWAWAGNTPFRLWKRYSWLGGTRVPMIVRYPRAIPDPGGVRTQFSHLVDVLPTVLDVCGVSAPGVVAGVAQQPLDGVSLRETFADPAARERHTTQYFEMLGSRAIVHDGWKATTDHISRGVADEIRLIPGSRDFETDSWSLFRLPEDFAESTDVSGDHPEVLAELIGLWEREAQRNQVFPLNDSLWMKDWATAVEPRMWSARRLSVRPGAGYLPTEALPAFASGADVRADLDVPEAACSGVLCAVGNWTTGWALIVEAGVPVLVVSAASSPYRVAAGCALTPGRRTVGFRYVPSPEGGGTALLLIDDAVVAAGRLAEGIAHGSAELRVGYDEGFPVSKDYSPPAPWPGTVHEVTIDAAPLSPSQAQIAFTEELAKD